MTDRICIHINTKNRPTYLAVTLASVLGQTFQNWDLIIMDASNEPAVNDETVGRLLTTVRRYGHKVSYERDNSLGIAQTYQKMLELSDTPLCLRMEDDVWWEPEMLARLYEVMEARPEVAACGMMTPHYASSGLVDPTPEKLRNGFSYALSNRGNVLIS